MPALRRDVRQVGRNHVDGCLQRVEQVAFEKHDSVFDVVAPRVVPGDLQGCAGGVGGGEMSLRQPAGQRDGDSTGACANVDDAPKAQTTPVSLRTDLDQELRLRPGNEDIRRDAEIEAVELTFVR